MSEFQLVYKPITDKNVEILKILVSRCFPLTYSNQLYEKIVRDHKETSIYAYINELPVGAIVTRVEQEPVDDLGASDAVEP